MGLVSMEGTVDLHIHTHPDLSPRLLDDDEAAKRAHEASMSAIVLKCHHESTVSRARALDRRYGNLRVFGGIVLNHYVGGINPAAAEAALRLGACQVWMPTADSAHNSNVMQSLGIVDRRSSLRSGRSGISLLDQWGTSLTSETLEVLSLIKEHDAILGTSHICFEEMVALLLAARDMGIKKVLITHPFFRVPGLTLQQLKHAVGLGGIAEFGYATLASGINGVTRAFIRDAIREIGVDNCGIMSDCGQVHNPYPDEALRIFAQGLHDEGLSERDVLKLIKDNPINLLKMD